ncbi:MAG: phosphoglycerate dehydrogenase [Oscillospiraceae bacterium]|nr:phosphoglycerate dehydrogenase [Oscillospiraceae bacterium]
MAKKVLIAKPAFKKFSPTGYQMLLNQGYDVITTDLDRDYFLEELLPLVGDIDGCIANCEPWGEKAMSAAPKLKILARYGTGMNSVDTEAAKRHGVMVTNCPGVNANAVAEHVIALMMGAVRDLVHLNDMTKQGLWKNLTFHEVAGATVGILGFGAIGRLVAKKLTGFDCRVLAYDVAPDYEVGDQYHVRFMSFEEVMSQSDIIFILVPLLPDTENMINRESLKLCKKGVIFVTDARGEVVDEKAMYDALVGGQVGFFASDVFVHEPATPENTPLLKLPNVITTSHNGAETYENLEKCGIMTAQQIIDALEGREPVNRRV